MSVVRNDFWAEYRRNRDYRGMWRLGQYIVPDFFRSGDYWVVKSEQVNIQGRYSLEAGYALTGLAFGGPFLQSHVLKIDKMWEGKAQLRWDGQRAGTDLTNSLVQVSLTFLPNGKFSSGTLNLPGGVRVELVRVTWNNGFSASVTATITMRKQVGGQDGHCGRADGNMADDTKTHLTTHWGSEVAKRENLFRGATVLLQGGEAALGGAGGPDEVALVGADPEPDDAYNPAEVCANSPPLAEDLRLCQAALNSSAAVVADALLPGCIIDLCVGGPEAIEAVAATARLVTEWAEAAGAPPSAAPDGWYDAGPQKTCDEGCQAVGLVCTEEQLRAHNSDVDSPGKVRTLIRQVGGKTLARKCDQTWGSEDDVPNWWLGGCHGSVASRPSSSFSCAARPRGTLLPKHRLCYCHAAS